MERRLPDNSDIDRTHTALRKRADIPQEDGLYFWRESPEVSTWAIVELKVLGDPNSCSGLAIMSFLDHRESIAVSCGEYAEAMPLCEWVRIEEPIVG